MPSSEGMTPLPPPSATEEQQAEEIVVASGIQSEDVEAFIRVRDLVAQALAEKRGLIRDLTTSLENSNARTAEQEKKFRELLWLGHGCDVAGLYGDDGQMQCGRCIIDFKHSTLEHTIARLADRQKARTAQMAGDYTVVMNKLIDANRRTAQMEQEIAGLKAELASQPTQGYIDGVLAVADDMDTQDGRLQALRRVIQSHERHNIWALDTIASLKQEIARLTKEAEEFKRDMKL